MQAKDIVAVNYHRFVRKVHEEGTMNYKQKNITLSVKINFIFQD